MTKRFWTFNNFRPAIGWLLGLLVGGMSVAVSAQGIVLHLKSGDKISGMVLSENSKVVVISNAWASSLPVPVAEIASRENSKTASKPAVKTAKSKAVRAPAPGKLAAVSTSASQPKPKPRGKWKGQVNLGLDTLLSSKMQQDYFGKLKLTYARPYAVNGKKFFRNTAQFAGEYQRTDGQESANRANGKDKADFDIGTKSYGYGVAGAGFDEVRRVDFKYQLGSGAGSHLVRLDNTALDVESGINYESEYRRHADNLESFFLRLAEDWTWKIRRNLKLTEKFEFYPNLEPMNLGQYHLDFTSTLSYGFWRNLTLDLMADDGYNTEVVSGVPRNEFEVRLTLGATF